MTTRPIPESDWEQSSNSLPGQGNSSRATQTVGSYRAYADAEAAVDRLSDNRFPVETVAIVGRGLNTVEQVTGRRTYWTAAGLYAISGAVVGALIGWFLGLFDLVDPLVASLRLALWGALLGAAVGAIIGLLGHLATGSRRDFSSVGMVRADHYDVQVDARYAREAARILYAADDESDEPPAGAPIEPDATDPGTRHRRW